MANLRVLVFCMLFLVPLYSVAQPPTLTGRDITGLWKGTLYNDSTGRTTAYEIGISEEKGRLSGFTHTIFIVDDKEYYGVKRVKIRTQRDRVVVETVELIANNYAITPPKGIKQIDVLTLEIDDSLMILSGPFVTNRTKEYAPLTGRIRVQRKNDFRQSALVPHLQELGLVNELSFVAAEKKPEPVVIAKPVEVKENKSVAVVTPAKTKKEKTVKVIAPAEPKADVIKVVEKPAVPTIVLPAADVVKRRTTTTQEVYFASDSLVLTLYDNGEVDGDTVSVLMNGKIIMPMVGLTTKAVRKTIYINKETPDSIQLVMYAETLGSIPPNTGLLIVQDGEKVYEIRFSGDYENNAAIILRRKLPGIK